MRLFVAIELSDEVRGAVAREQARLAALLGGGRGGVRWVRPGQLHLTLVFLGEVDEPRGQAIVEAMTGPLAARVFELGLGGVGLFPPEGPPRVVWLGVARGARETMDAQGEVAGRLEPFGVAREARPFRPHLTLGRWRTRSPADRRSMVAAAAGDPIPVMTVTSVTLYESRLGSDGPTHTPLARASLTHD